MNGKGKIQNNNIGKKKNESGTEYEVNDTNECYSCELIRGGSENDLKECSSISLLCGVNCLH